MSHFLRLLFFRKNNKGTRKRQHDYSLRREQEEAIKKQAKKEKKTRTTGMEVDGVKKKAKKGGFRIRKGGASSIAPETNGCQLMPKCLGVA